MSGRGSALQSPLTRTLLQRRAAIFTAMRRRSAARQQQIARSRQQRRSRSRLATTGSQERSSKAVDRKKDDETLVSADDDGTPASLKSTEPSKAAAAKLRLAKQLLERGRKVSARRWLAKVVAKFPGTPQAAEAERLLASTP